MELTRLLYDDRFDFRFSCGYNKPTNNMSLDDKSSFINAIWLHYTFFQPHAELQQLRKGFRDTLQMELLICLHSDDVRSLLLPSRMFDVTPAFLLDSFVVHYSEHGTNLRTLEEAVMLNWSEFITDCSGIQLLLRYCCYINIVYIVQPRLSKPPWPASKSKRSDKQKVRIF